MKYYSDITNILYDTEEDLLKDEEKVTEKTKIETKDLEEFAENIEAIVNAIDKIELYIRGMLDKYENNPNVLTKMKKIMRKYLL